MRNTTRQTRENRTITVDFRDETTYFQLLNDGRRWWIVTIFWDSERPDNRIPERYLGRP